MSKEVCTIILRFRDLGKPDGFTIEEHQKIITSKGSVWWGWWNKPHESVEQVQQISALGDRARDGGIELFLLDSGCSVLYKCQCCDIRKTKDRKEAPEIDVVPSYYQDQKFYLWFRFTSIKECSTEELQSYSYVNIPSFISQYEEHIDCFAFDNKQVYSVSELIQQNRTMWFLRPLLKTDRMAEIILMGSSLACHFNKSYEAVDGNKLLWLSDLHLFENVFPKNGNERSLFSHLQTATEDFKDIGGLLITGDITSFGKEDGFQTAIDLISDINSATNRRFQSKNIVICPGNHDFGRIDSNFKPDDIHPMPSMVMDEINKDNHKAYSEFYKKIYSLYPNDFASCGRKIVLSSGRTVEIVSLNSLLYQQYKNFEGHGYISQKQMEDAEKQMGWDKNNNTSAIRIVMMHHHYMPTCFVEEVNVNRSSSVVYDADNLMQWLVKNNVRILLHGHKHKTFAAQVQYPKDTQKDICFAGNLQNIHQITVLGMGGTAANCNDNCFATLNFNIDSVDVEYYTIFRDKSNPDGLSRRITITL